MNNFDSAAYNVWHPDLYGIVQRAIDQRSSVTIQSHFPLDPCNSADLSLFGRFLKITGQQVQYIVNEFDLDLGKTYAPAPECEYSFAVEMPRGMSGGSKVEYGGRALILDQELQKNDLPEGLLLRISMPCRIRPMRRHKREVCPDNMIMMPGLLLIDQEPVNRRRLLNVLSHYYRQKTRPKPRLVNISAGGVCLETEDPHCQKFMGAEESYLFFFFSEENGPLKCPNVFLGKKVGIFRTGNSRPAGLRIRFLREMVWTDPLEDLKWQDIENDGSPTIRKLLDKWRHGKNVLSDKKD